MAVRSGSTTCFARIALLTAWVIATPALAISEPPPAAERPAAPVVEKAAPPAYADATALLTQLEAGDQGLTALQAEILLHRSFALEGDEQTRWGMLYFRQIENPENPLGRALRQFAVRFDKVMIDRRLEDKEQRFIFDGVWLAEINPEEKRFNKRQVVAHGENFDPLKIGEGPLPIPIGQKKEDILSRFVAELRPVTEGIDDGTDRKQADAWRKFVSGSVQLKLTPKAAGEDEDFTEIRLWYKPALKQEGIEDGRLMPRMSRTVNRAGDVTTVQLVGIAINFPIDGGFFNAEAPKERGWDIVIAPLNRPAPPPPELKAETKVLPAEDGKKTPPPVSPESQKDRKGPAVAPAPATSPAEGTSGQPGSKSPAEKPDQNPRE